MCTAKGSDVRPGVPRAPPLLRGRRATMCIAGGFCVAAVARTHIIHSITPTHSLTDTFTHTHTLTHSLTHSPSLTHLHSLTFTHSPSLTHLTHPPHSLTHSLTFTHPPHSHHHSLTHSLTHPPTHSLTHTHLLIHSPVHAHTYTHTQKLTHHHPSITLILPLPSCFSMLSLSLEKLVTCGVIRSYNYIIIIYLQYFTVIYI